MRFNHVKLFVWVVFITSCSSLIAQDEPFKGGVGDGFTIDTTNQEFNEFTSGGLGDGFTSGNLFIVFNDFTSGGVGDGFSTDSANQEFLDFTAGGMGDGFSSETTNQEFLDFTSGGIGDGFSKGTISNIFNDFAKGSLGDGFTTSLYTNNFADFCFGGIGDGFATDELSAEFNDFTSGGNADGFSFAHTATNDFNDMHKGGDSDGFAYDKYGHIILWTGISGTGWNTAGNWENGIIPSYCNPVVIPAGAPNFPAVNAGLLRIGYYKNEGDYKCQRIKIETGAEMLTRTNCFVENYNIIFIQGKLYVKNPAANAFSNLGQGLIHLKPSAEMIVKE